MTEKEMNKLADLIVDKLLTKYIQQGASWYTSSTLDYMEKYFPGIGKKPKKNNTEEELLGELASLMTQLNIYQEKEEYEKCAKIKKKIDILKKKLDDTN
tara:strand:+ start:198 stop:494 length:297 start_codon:yes stop_codon:yes gene_type:complete